MTASKKPTLHAAEEAVQRLIEDADDVTLRHPEYRNYVGGLENARNFLKGARAALEETDAVEGREARSISHNEKQGLRGDHESSGDGADLGERTKPEPRGKRAMDAEAQARFEGVPERAWRGEKGDE